MLYWNFLLQQQTELDANPRTVLMAKNAAHLSTTDRDRWRAEAEALLGRLDTL